MSETTTTPTRDEDDLATLLAKREHARPNRITWALLALLLVAIGFVGGAVAYERYGPAASPGLPTFGGGLPDFVSNGGLPSGMPGSASSGGSSDSTAQTTTTQGTVKLVDGDTVYVATDDDSVVIVTVPDNAPVTTQKAIRLSDLAVGSTVTVAGAAGTDGKVIADSVSEDAPSTDASSTTPTKE